VIAGDIESPFYASIIRGIGDVARTQGFGIIVTNSDENAQLEREAVQLLLEKQVDGIIVAPANLRRPQHLIDAVAGGCPVVQIDRIAEGLKADSVTVDNILAAHQCVTRLILSGHCKIGFLGELEMGYLGDLGSFLDLVDRSPPAPRTLYPSWQRLLGYLDAHRAARLPIDRALVRRVGAYSSAAAKAETLDLLRKQPRPTALFTGDGTMSAGALEAITALSLRVPADLSLVCFDDLDWMKFVGSGITAASQPVQEMGRTAGQLILGRINGNIEPTRHMVLAVQITERNSVEKPHSWNSVRY
jgi:LacI family transcriptional regulator